MSAEVKAESTSKGPVKSKGRKKLIRPRGKRGGVKNRKANLKAAETPVPKKTVKSSKNEDEKTEHSQNIAAFHTLLKRIAQTKDAGEKAKLEQQLIKEHGGLDAYQKESLKGRDRLNAGETGKWLAEQLAETWKEQQDEDGKRKLRLLDVGSLSGTAYAKFPWVDPTSIDLNPQGETVIKSDFFEFPVPDNADEKYDCVSLSLVINFEGDLHRRGEMLIHAHEYLTSKGYLYVVLPLACVSNSRYLDHDRMRAILSSCGWEILVQSDSKRLTRWLCQRKQPSGKKKSKKTQAGWDGTILKKEEVRKGPSFNNFCIRVGRSDTEG